MMMWGCQTRWNCRSSGQQEAVSESFFAVLVFFFAGASSALAAPVGAFAPEAMAAGINNVAIKAPVSNLFMLKVIGISLLNFSICPRI